MNTIIHYEKVHDASALMLCCCASAFLVFQTAFAAGMSSLTVCQHFDNHSLPEVRSADDGKAVAISYSGEWFASGSCSLLVDDELVATSQGEWGSYVLTPPLDAPRTWRVTLSSAEGEVTKFVTVKPSAEFPMSCHGLTTAKAGLDSWPAGTVRKLKLDASMSVTWSDVWNVETSGATVTLYEGKGTSGTCLGRLVEAENGEGEVRLSPTLMSLGLGMYTLTHDDGVEVLVAYVRVTGGGFTIIVM